MPTFRSGQMFALAVNFSLTNKFIIRNYADTHFPINAIMKRSQNILVLLTPSVA